MKNFLSTLKPAVPGLILLAAIGWGAWRSIVGLVHVLQGLKSDLAVAIVAAAVAGFFSIVSLAISKAYDTRLAIRQELRGKKTPVYERVVKTLFLTTHADKMGKKPPTGPELVAFFAETTELLTIWGSEDVIKKLAKFKTISEAPPPHGMFVFEDFLLAIRKDLGHSNRGLVRGSLLRLFINDIDQNLIPKRKR